MAARKLSELPSAKPRESKYDLDFVISKLSSINEDIYNIKINDPWVEIVLCLANEIKRLKNENKRFTT